MGDSVRILLAAPQATRDVEPTTGWKNIPIKKGSGSWQPKRDRIEDEIETGTRVKTTEILRGGNEDMLSLSTLLYFETIPILHAPFFSSFVTTNHGSATGVKNHVAKDGSNLPLIAFRYYDGVQWWQMLNCQGSELDINIGNKVSPVADYKYVGTSGQKLPVMTITDATGLGAVVEAVVNSAGVITSVTIVEAGTGYTAPTIAAGGPGTGATFTVTLGTGATAGQITGVAVTAGGTGYIPSVAQVQGKAIDWPMLLVKINGTQYVDYISGKLSFKNDLEGLWTGNRTADPTRFMEGDFQPAYEILPDFKSDTASLFQQWRNNKEPGPIEIEFADTRRAIGSATPTIPVLRYKIHRPFHKTGDHDMKTKNTRTPIKGIGGLNYTDGCAASVTFVNTETSYAP